MRFLKLRDIVIGSAIALGVANPNNAGSIYGGSGEFDRAIAILEIVGEEPSPAEKNYVASKKVVYEVVKSGDNLTKIARRLEDKYDTNVSSQKLHEQNNFIKNPNLIYPGQILRYQFDRYYTLSLGHDGENFSL